MKCTESDFLFGAQYYRAPTPDTSCWEQDLERMAGQGQILYAGTDFGLAAEISGDRSGLERILNLCSEQTGLNPPEGIQTPRNTEVRIDHIRDRENRLAFVSAHNNSDQPAKVRLSGDTFLISIFENGSVSPGEEIVLPPKSADLYVAPL